MLKNFIIPAIDIKEGKVVRLFKGDFERLRDYGKTPEEMARFYEELGFGRIHVVDLDGALKGSLANLEFVRKIRKAFKGILQVGGGIRSCEDAKILFEEGVDLGGGRIITIKKPEEFESILSMYPGKVILSVDSKEGRVAIDGWRKKSSLLPEELASAFEGRSLWGYLYTDIDRDGTLEGVDEEKYRRFKALVKKPLLASGGVKSLEDVKVLTCCTDGVVVGRAIYEGLINLAEIY